MFENKSVKETIELLKTDINSGLAEEEAAKRLKENGLNELKEKPGKTIVESFFEQLNDPLIYVLLAAAVVSVILKEISDSVIISIVVVINAVVGVVQEGKAQRALDSLKKLTSPHAVVLRDGVKREIKAAELVVGDIVCLEAGCSVPADIRLTQSENLKIEESALTGESLPVQKDCGYRKSGDGEIPLGDRKNMVYMSTMVIGGRGEGIVTATGMDTEIGKIASIITGAKEELTPLQKRLGELGKILSILSLALCGLLFLIAVIQERNIPEMLITAISLAVAAVPEGLPAVVTICLALSVTRMVRVNTIVRKLPSVETLGAVSVVCSDKTGTLTQNRMSVEKCWLDGRLIPANELAEYCGDGEFLKALVLCNDASLSGKNHLGDPTETALLEMADKCGFSKKEMDCKFPRCDEKTFDSERKMMTTVHEGSRLGRIAYSKGAADEIIKKCSKIRINGVNRALTKEYESMITEAVTEMSGNALRTLAASMRIYNGRVEEENMVFLGLVGMTDPARPEAKEAVSTFKKAGVRTVMITGDHIDTAYAIGRQLGIADKASQCMSGIELNNITDDELGAKIRDKRIFARVSPAQKVRIVNGFRHNGEIVAMTGDGVNDAPSLKTADIGIAMGMAGTDVAKQASDMILTDDNFATIEKAIEEGRSVYENIRKSVIFLLSSNLGEILTMFVAVACGIASPLKSSHILWINLITDSLPALALGIDVNDADELMNNPPRKSDESLFSRGGFACTAFYGILIAGISLTAFLMLPAAWVSIQNSPVNTGNLAIILRQKEMLSRAQTYAFTVLSLSQLFHAVGMRDVHRSVFKMNPFKNKLMIFACLAGFLLQFSVTRIPFLINAFGTVRLTGKEWLLLIVLAAFPMLAHEVMVLVEKIRLRL